MNQTVKILLTALIIFILGGVSVIGYSMYSNLKKENQELKEQVSLTPTQGVEEEVMEPEPTEEASDKGAIEGTLGYPSEMIPPLTVYAYVANDATKYFFVRTAQNESTFRIEEIDPGEYVVVAYTDNPSDLGGGYTNAVPCGLTVECDDHNLIFVEVKAGETATGVEVKDWYAPEGTYPVHP